VGAEDHVEAIVKADYLERALDEGNRGVGDEPDRRPALLEAVQQLARADHRLHPVLELGDDQFVELVDQRVRSTGLPELPFEDAAGDLGRGADQFALVRGRELDSPSLEEIALGAGPDRLGVEQQPVVVEDHRLRGGGHLCAQLRHRQASAASKAPSSASTSPSSFSSASAS
jgi:hypothetical protein